MQQFLYGTGTYYSLQALVIGCVVTCNSDNLIATETGDATLNVKN